MNRLPSVILLSSLMIGVSACLADGIAIPLHPTAGETYAVEARIEGVDEKVAMTLDTGAAYSTLSNDVIKVLLAQGKAVKTGELTARLANGDFCPLYTYTISSLTIGEHCDLQNVEVAVAEGHSRNLLGLSTLQRTAPFTIAFAPQATLNVQSCHPVSQDETRVSLNR